MEGELNRIDVGRECELQNAVKVCTQAGHGCMECSRMPLAPNRLCFFFNDTGTTEIYTLSLHDALPILHEVVIKTSAGLSKEACREGDPERSRRRDACVEPLDVAPLGLLDGSGGRQSRRQHLEPHFGEIGRAHV